MQRLEIWLEILIAVPCGQYRDFRHTQQCPTPLQAFLAIYSHLHINVLVPPTDAEAVPPGANATTRDMLRTLRSLPSFRPGIAYVLDTLYLAPTVCNTC